jgi:VanZ family protein
MITSRLPRLLSAPFLGYYVNPEFKAMRDLFLKMALGFPLGLFVRLAMAPSSAGPWRTVASLTAIALFSATLEVGQVFLPSRFPDNTDVLLATAAAWLGMRLADPFLGVRSGTPC